MSGSPEESRPPGIAGYEFVRRLAEGGYSIVYQYRELTPDRDVAVKVLKDAGLGEEVIRQRIAEANAMGKVGSHPNVVEVLTTGVTDDGRHYIVMPYCPACLWDLARAGRLDLRKVLRAGVQVAGAVAAAHNEKIVHRDIKPANILVDKYGNACLTDFGIAGRLGPGDPDEEVGLSVPWSPKEILDGGRGSEASDVYSLGATLWHLLVGRSPFDLSGHNSRAALEMRIRSTPAPRTGRADVPLALEDLLQEMLDKDPLRRPASAVLVAERLGRIEESCGGPVANDAPWHSPGPELHPGEQVDLDHTLDPPRGRRQPLLVPALPMLTETVKPPKPVEEPPPQPAPRPTRRAWWVWGAAVAVVLGAAAFSVSHFAGGTAPATTPVATDAGAGPQDAGSLGDDGPPGEPTVTASRVDRVTLRFTWTYSTALASDTFIWRTEDGKRTGTATSPTVDLADPLGTKLCVQVKVVRASGGFGAVDFSRAGCGK